MGRSMAFRTFQEEENLANWLDAREDGFETISLPTLWILFEHADAI